MKKFFKFAAIAAITAAFVSCTEKPGPEPTPEPGPGTTPEYTEDLTFTLEVAEVEADKAKIKVEHNGTTKDTWYGFATTESDVDKAIADVLEEGNVSLKKNTKTTVTVRSLEPETEYTFIAVGIKADGTTYGEPATVKFTTSKAEEPTPPAPTPGEYTINPNWTVTYIGDYEQDGKVYNNVIAVETTDTNPYFVTAWPVDYFEELGIATIVDEEIKAWEELLAQYPGASWENDILYAEAVETIPSYKMFDFYSRLGVEGIVISLDEGTNGQHGWIVSTDEAELEWSTKDVSTLLGFSNTDAAQNLKLILQEDPTLEAFPAFKWCDDKNTTRITLEELEQNGVEGRWILLPGTSMKNLFCDQFLTYNNTNNLNSLNAAIESASVPSSSKVLLPKIDWDDPYYTIDYWTSYKIGGQNMGRIVRCQSNDYTYFGGTGVFLSNSDLSIKCKVRAFYHF